MFDELKLIKFIVRKVCWYWYGIFEFLEKGFIKVLGEISIVILKLGIFNVGIVLI